MTFNLKTKVIESVSCLLPLLLSYIEISVNLDYESWLWLVPKNDIEILYTLDITAPRVLLHYSTEQKFNIIKQEIQQRRPSRHQQTPSLNLHTSEWCCFCCVGIAGHMWLFSPFVVFWRSWLKILNSVCTLPSGSRRGKHAILFIDPYLVLKWVILFNNRDIGNCV